MSNTIFVFGSNLAGRHGMGSALEAHQHWGAEYGVGVGPTGQAYAIPTKDDKLRKLSLSAVWAYVEMFIQYARKHPELQFQLVAIGCGLAGFTPEQIAPLFAEAPENVQLPEAFSEVFRKLAPIYG